jgi:uncharacterized OsmC-like protein
MTIDSIATALQRLTTVLGRRPELGLHEDAAAVARWQGGVNIECRHANGTSVRTDMPRDLGGGGNEVTPGWLFRAGLASCFATCVALQAAADGIVLTLLEVSAHSRSDTRGLLGMSTQEGAPVCAASRDIRLHVRLAAPDAAPHRLEALVTQTLRCSPIPSLVQRAVPVELDIEVV